MAALANIDGSLKRDSNDCLLKDIEKKEKVHGRRFDVRNIFDKFSPSQDWAKRDLTRLKVED